MQFRYCRLAPAKGVVLAWRVSARPRSERTFMHSEENFSGVDAIDWNVFIENRNEFTKCNKNLFGYHYQTGLVVLSDDLQQASVFRAGLTVSPFGEFATKQTTSVD